MSIDPPLWLLAELTYRCPLQCPYCSNPVEFAGVREELSTAEWLKVLRDGRELGAVQLGFSGGEPLLRPDLEEIVAVSRRLGYYSNLITSGIGMDEDRVGRLREAGLDHIQLSFQAGEAGLSDAFAGTQAFAHKKAMARAVKAAGYPMVLNFVLHRRNIDQIETMLELAVELGADYVELAHTQYHGWALLNRDALLPAPEQVAAAERVAKAWQAKLAGKMKIYYVLPDYFEGRPKACVGGWGSVFITVAPDGAVLPCHSARSLPGLEFPSVREQSLAEIWRNSPLFNRFRGEDWMREPCRSCPEREKDFGGCRCQAYLLTGDAANADPTCTLSPHHGLIQDAIVRRQERPLVFRNSRESRRSSATRAEPRVNP